MTGSPLGHRLPRLAYGGDYNPDQWPEEVWSEDVRLMREAGVNLVSLGIFSWSRLQPREDSFEFGWLDRLMDLLHESGVAVDLATATASPPPWLSHRHPEMLPVTADGVRLWPGGRQHYCPSSPVYRNAAGRLVSALAERYASHPALAMWHVGNEYGCHVPACWCDESARDFRDWLRQRYHSLEELNRAWGTDFWSQRYSAWEEILPPRRAPTWPNPSQQLDFHRFSSDALLECYELERSVLAEQSPGVPITTNFMGFFKPLDYWKWAEREDVVSNDSYPDPADPDAHVGAAMAGDLMRSLGRGRPWLLMEQTPNRVNWRPVNVAKAPGQMRLWSYQAVARGADGVMFFQWRQSRASAEKFHSAMVPHGPVESSPTWREVVRLGRELRDLDDV
ncbi:MAG TPA: beta-galactosidase, partial [Candidatus Dormibacteraeota bacterium]|nr:beta-galactosidase [Candidatus Dormibacteraeota bacterium]